jgi:hypothetical protein
MLQSSSHSHIRILRAMGMVGESALRLWFCKTIGQSEQLRILQETIRNCTLWLRLPLLCGELLGWAQAIATVNRKKWSKMISGLNQPG